MDPKVTISLSSLEGVERYQLLSSLIVPRPIAWVSTVSKAGVTNIAPFSFFNVFGSKPPLVLLCQGNRVNGELKDTPANIHDTGEFVINMVPQELAAPMNASAVDLEKGKSEIDALDLQTNPAHRVKAPLIANCPANLECKWIESREYGDNRVVVGEVLMVHLDPDCYDSQTGLVTPNYQPIGKMGGTEYCLTDDRFSLERPLSIGKNESGDQ